MVRLRSIHSGLASVTLALSAVLTGGCAAESGGDDGAECTGSKCDKPDDSDPADMCELREADAVDGAQKAYTHDHIRWACSDVDGVNTNNQDDRGQEYCEYFAIVQPPPTTAGGEPPDPVRVGRGSDDLAVVLNDDQIAALDEDPSAVAGQCVFTSWHEDAPGPLPACADSASCPEVLGFPLTDDNYRMLDGVNSNSAARMLVNDCFAAGPAGDPADSSDPLNSSYYRGCMMCGDLGDKCVFWRRSDPTICAGIMRLAECGCGLDIDGDGTADPVDLAETLIPPQPTDDGVTLRGFPLGTWSGANKLPAGCRYADTGDESQTIVTCDLTGSDLIAGQGDPKGRCRDKYGDNIVVHVPVPADKIVCKSPPEGPYAATCDGDPWVL